MQGGAYSKGSGTLGEVRAEQYLVGKGYTILERNFRIRGAEIDLIARDGEYLVFCEVKLRRGTISGREAVTPAQMKRISRAALAYTVRAGIPNFRARFDVLELSRDGIVHIPNAFPYCGGTY